MTHSNVPARVDAAQPAIVDALRAAGATVTSLAPIGKGCPDLVVGYLGTTSLLEVKTARRRVVDPLKDLSPAELRWLAAWGGAPAHVVYTPDEAVALVCSGGAASRRMLDGLNATAAPVSTLRSSNVGGAG